MRRLRLQARTSRYSRCRHFSASASAPSLDDLKRSHQNDIEALPESRACRLLENFLEAKCDVWTNSEAPRLAVPPTPPPGGYHHTLDSHQIRVTLDAALATFCLHVESRIAALVGKGFYTIGPCGEESLSSVAHAFSSQDSVALHYRHLGINLARQMLVNPALSLDDLLLDRARGYTCSRLDPVTGGVHCSIGSARGDEDTLGGDFIVTSTLASQCPSAVGRALGYALTPNQSLALRDERPISFVTVGDGSVHNHHFWSAFHLARHARHKQIKCPVVFGIADNGLSISYRTGGYVDTLFGHDPLVQVFRANGQDMMDVYSQSRLAFDYARKQSAPAVILYKGLVRRFGHAASDRQIAYLDAQQIESMADTDVLESSIVQAVEVFSAVTYSEIRDAFGEIRKKTQSAFEQASGEAKVNRNDMLERASAPLVAVPRLPNNVTAPSNAEGASSPGKREVMRKHMTRVITEVMEQDESVVYLGEDVRHGGYYLVTEGLVDDFPTRILDFPPDETSLLGAAMGFSQHGLTPIVEIPYAKYLDCGADMFYEIAIMYWLSAGQRPNGMIIRIQGFGRGLFGGNFHTTNMLQHIPPGVDVVCFSNGEDYVRGFRHAIANAKAGRVVMFIDCTSLLNLRHLHEKDRGWERTYPSSAENEMMGFDDVRRYGTSGSLAIVSYGDGVVSSLRARKALAEIGVISSEEAVDVIDCPYLSRIPDGLRETIVQYQGVVFADICKEGPGSSVFSSVASGLHSEGLLPSAWEVIGAPRTYNPLGNMTTFLNEDDVIEGIKRVLGRMEVLNGS